MITLFYILIPLCSILAVICFILFCTCKTDGAFVAFIVWLLAIALLYFGFYCGKRQKEQAAIDAGAAIYKVDSDGDVTFHWSK
jgi:hypothetical protein